MPTRALVISIHPEYAKRIFEGSKTVELRRITPRTPAGTLMIIYVTSPVQAVCGVCRVQSIVEGDPSTLWPRVREAAHISPQEYAAYYYGATSACAIHIDDVLPFDPPIPLTELVRVSPGFKAPQSYRYVAPSGPTAGIWSTVTAVLSRSAPV